MRDLIPQHPGDDQPAAIRGDPTPANVLAIKQWTRDYLRLNDGAFVTVTELACADPGCPLIETVIAVFEEGRTRKWRLHRPRAAVTKIMIQQALAGHPG